MSAKEVREEFAKLRDAQTDLMATQTLQAADLRREIKDNRCRCDAPVCSRHPAGGNVASEVAGLEERLEARLSKLDQIDEFCDLLRGVKQASGSKE